MTRTSPRRTNTAIVISSTAIVGLVLVLALQFALHFNWETFLPDLLVGLATGLVVGLVLARSQSRAERSLDRRDMEHAWVALRPRVATEMNLLSYQLAESDMTSIFEFVYQFDELEALLREKPLGVWEEELDHPELSHLRKFIQSFPPLRWRTETAMESLASEMSRKVRLHRSTGSMQLALEVACRRLMGAPATTRGIGMETHEAWVAAADQVFAENPIYGELVADIATLAQTVETARSTIGDAP